MSLKVWQKRVMTYDGGEPIPQSLITQIKSLFNRNIYQIAKEEVAYLETVVIYDGHGPGWTITNVQTDRGKKWLQRSDIQKRLSPIQQRILNNFDHFTFEGVLVNVSGLCITGKLIYRVHSKNKSYFDYTAAPWQDGTKDTFDVLTTVIK